MTGPRPAPIPSVLSAKRDKKKKKKAAMAEHSHSSQPPSKDGSVELAEMETKAGSVDGGNGTAGEEQVVLTDKEQNRLRLAQVRSWSGLARSGLTEGS